MPFIPATWVSHSSISDFLKCPRAYYLKNVYKNENTGNKIQIASPALSLGSAIHEVVEGLSNIKTEGRFDVPLVKRFDEIWQRYGGKKGGFLSIEIENQYKKRGEDMLEKIRKNPGPLSKPAVKINMDLPQFHLSSEGDLILCGKIDWLEYDPQKDGVTIIDFKTSQEVREDPQSLQLPIYFVLTKNCQKHKILGASYWYIDQSETPTQKDLPSYDESLEKIISVARRIKLARQLGSMNCPNGDKGCRECLTYERILNGEGELVYTDKQNRKDIYILPNIQEDRDGTIL